MTMGPEVQLRSFNSINDRNRRNTNRPVTTGRKLDTPNTLDLLPDLDLDNNEDTFHEEVARTTGVKRVGRYEAEMEVVVDRLIKKHETANKALLFVVSGKLKEVEVLEILSKLLPRGADPSFCDPTSKSTPLHEATKGGLKGVVSRLLKCKALPNARDRENRMPLHLAITQKHDAIAAMLLDSMPNRSIRRLFQSQDDKPAEFSLHQLIKQNMQQTVLAVLDSMVDMIGESGYVKVHYHVLEADEKGRAPGQQDFSPRDRSCLQLLATGGYKDIVCHDVVRLLIRRKWKDFAQARCHFHGFLYLVTQLTLFFSVVSATMVPDPTEYSGGLHVARAVTEMYSVIVVFISLLLELQQLWKNRLHYFKDTFNWIDLLSCCLLLCVVGLRWANRGEQWPVFSVGFFFWTLRIFKYAAIFRQTGVYAQILWRVVASDFPQFLVVFLVILLTFSGSFLLALRGEDSLGVHQETSTFWYIMFSGVRILIEAAPVVHYTGSDGFKPLSSVLMTGYLFVCIVVLLNMLIAQLSDTYQSVQRDWDAHRGQELHRAWMVAQVELNSLFLGKDHRTSQYVPVEVVQTPVEGVEKWETPPLLDISQQVRGTWNSLESQKLNLQTINSRICRLEDKLDNMLDMMAQQTQSIVSEQTHSTHV